MKKILFKVMATVIVLMTLCMGNAFAQSQAMINFAAKEGIPVSQVQELTIPGSVPSKNELLIYGNVTISGGTLFYPFHIVVMPNAHLTVSNAVIGFEPYCYLTVMAKGKLTLENSSRLTSTSSLISEYWFGVFVAGNPTNCLANEQGLLIMNNSTIESANIGIDNYLVKDEMCYANTEGGIIQATNSTFRHNSCDVQIWSSISNGSTFFERCRFEATLPSGNTGHDVDARVFLGYARNISFKGCTFINNATGTVPTYGINAKFSSFTVDQHASLSTYPAPLPTKSSFSNFHIGIYADGEYMPNAPSACVTSYKQTRTSIKNSIFTNNKQGGALLANMTLPDFSACNVTIGHEAAYGLYLSHCSDFKVQNNTITNPVSEIYKGIGMYIEDCGHRPNQVYRNNFYNLRVGICPIGNNKTIVSNLFNPTVKNSLGGLRMNCNFFSGGQYDIAMRKRQNSDPTPTVAYLQGKGTDSKTWVRNRYGATCINQNKWFIEGPYTGVKTIYHPCYNSTITAPLPQPECSHLSLDVVTYNSPVPDYSRDCPNELDTYTLSDLDARIALLQNEISSKGSGGNLSVDVANEIAYAKYDLHALISEKITRYLDLGTEAGYAAAQTLMDTYWEKTDADKVVDAIAAGNYSLAQSMLNTLAQDPAYDGFVALQNLNIAYRQAVAQGGGICSGHIQDLLNYNYQPYTPLPEDDLPPIPPLPLKNAAANQAEATGSFKVFPVPAQDQITFEYMGDIEMVARVEIRDLAGRLVDNIILQSAQQQYATGHLLQGVYFATLTVNGKKTETQKIVIAK